MEDATIRINDILQVTRPDDPDFIPCQSRVEDCGEGILVIAWPSDRGTLISIHDGQVLTLSFVRQDAAYVSNAKVLLSGQEPIPFLKVQLLGPAARHQRRDFVREQVAVAVEMVGVIASARKGETVAFIKRSTFDLSGGGFSLRWESPLPLGSVLEAKLTLPDGDLPIKATVRVVTLDSIEVSGSQHIYHIGLSFSLITEKERRRIVRFLFRAEVRRRAALAELEMEDKE